MADANTLEELAHPSYWNARYSRTSEPPHEWFLSYSALKPFFDRHVPTLPFPAPTPSTDPILLHLGCGTSTLPIDLLHHGYHQLCVDFSHVVIDSMSTRHQETKNLEWRVMDVRDMAGVEDSSINVAIDKGTLDAMIHGSMWEPPEEVTRNTSTYMNEVLRVLRPGGVFLYITCQQPMFMLLILEREGWDVQMEVLSPRDGTLEYFGFVITKRGGEGSAT